jgi:hypothetical protein
MLLPLPIMAECAKTTAVCDQHAVGITDIGPCCGCQSACAVHPARQAHTGFGQTLPFVVICPQAVDIVPYLDPRSQPAHVHQQSQAHTAAKLALRRPACPHSEIASNGLPTFSDSK